VGGQVKQHEDSMEQLAGAEERGYCISGSSREFSEQLALPVVETCLRPFIIFCLFLISDQHSKSFLGSLANLCQ
jgi:hypothetical protein